jgi:putative transposase
MRTRYPKHLRSFTYVGLHRYSLTFCTKDRRPLFADATVVGPVLTQFSRAATECGFAITAYCFMPDHVHLLVEAQSDNSDCLHFISRAKQYSGFQYARASQGQLWQRYGFEHVLRDDEVALAVARYIIDNPVRAGIVDDPRDYPFSGSLVYPIDVLVDGIRSG